MLSANNRLITHDKIIDIMAQLGYEKVNVGVCNGLTQMLAQAILCEETAVFFTRLHFVCTEPTLLRKIETAKAKKGIQLTEQDQTCIDVLAFFDGVQLYQNMSLFTHLFNKKTGYLDATAISVLTQPIKLDKVAIVELYSDNRFFNFYDLRPYLDSLTMHFISFYKKRMARHLIGKKTPDIALCLHSCSHKIALRFCYAADQQHTWELLDSNQYPPPQLPCDKDSSSIRIMNALTEGLLAPVNISVFATSDNPLRSKIELSLSRLKHQYSITSEEASVCSLKGTHLLMLAAMQGDWACFMQVIEKIPKSKLPFYIVDATSAAIRNGQTRLAHWIIKHYPATLMHANVAQHCLTIAIQTKQNSLIKKLIRLSTKVHTSDNNNNTLLHIAVEADNVIAVKKLCSLQANINAINCHGQSPLMLAITLRHLNIVEYLASQPGINFRLLGTAGESMLTYALKMPSMASCEILLHHQADVNWRNHKNQTPALAACMVENWEGLKLLVHYGADLNLGSKHLTPILIAAIKKHWEMVSYILLNLQDLTSLNYFSYNLIVSDLPTIIQHAIASFNELFDGKKQTLWFDIKNQRNALGMLLTQHPRNHSFTFFQQPEKQRHAYLKQLRMALVPASEESVGRESRGGYVRI